MKSVYDCERRETTIIPLAHRPRMKKMMEIHAYIHDDLT